MGEAGRSNRPSLTHRIYVCYTRTMKTCGRCGVEKQLDAFHKRGKDGRQPICKQCRKDDDAARYKADPSYHNLTNKARRVEYTSRVRALKNAPCTDCDVVFHPAAMQWDHIDDNKSASVSEAVAELWGWDRILEEIAKCELVCANCHAVRTFNRLESKNGQGSTACAV